MTPPLKTLLTLSLLALMALPMSAIGKNQKLDNYDTMKGPPLMQKWVPRIPGTEGQKEVKVQVLDATTMQPIEGAIVVGGYYGPDGSGGTVCAKSESAISDAEGWATLPNDQDPRVGGKGGFSDLRGPRLESAYKRGYQMSIMVYYATPGGYNEWYVVGFKPVPRGTPGKQWEKISSRKFSDDHKSALMETKERSRIYLMPSTATTKEERWGELTQMGGSGCGRKLPFEFSESEGGLAAWKAVYQEMLDIGYSESTMKAERENIEHYEKSYLDFRKRNPKE
jgi:hypothetical protein